MIFSKSIEIAAYGPANLFDITDRIFDVVQESKVRGGNVLAFSIGSTGALVRLSEDEKVWDDFITWVRSNIPFDRAHRHPGNAFAHLRSTFFGCGVVVPVVEGRLILKGHRIVLLENTAGRKKRRVRLTIKGT